jgi:O-antigen/teichoic acid export membrane protein
MNNQSSSKRIAKNTLLLYFRMLFTMTVSLYTSRVILNILGVSDFGIYNIVGGIVILFSFLNNAMSSATQRFLNFEIGKNDLEQLRKVFCISMNVHVSIAFIVVVLAETIGLWFVNTQLNLPLDRMSAVNWVYQFSVLTFIINIIQVPYNATIISHERMSFYAYISIIEVSLKLSVVFLLQYFGSDKLKLYSVLISVVALIIIIIYRIYCTKKFESSKYYFFSDSSLYKQLLSFSGWSLFGSAANIGKYQVINVLLNIFCGVVVNATLGITNQVTVALNSFVSNFQLAFNPQIVKSYAANEKEYLMKLIFQTSKYSYYLLFILSFPILLNTDYILKLWLKTVPEYTLEFCQLSIIYLLIESISGPLWMSVQATGKIKNYQIAISSVLLLNIPFSYILLKLNYVPYSILWVNIGIGLIALITRIVFLKFLINLPIIKFFKEVILNLIIVTIVSIPLPFIISHYATIGFWKFLISSATALLSVIFFVYLVGLKTIEKKYAKNQLINILNKLIN